MKITNNLKLYRESRNLSQAKLAKMVDINETYYQKIEYGLSKPNIEIVLLLAQALNTKVENLFSIQKKPDAQSD